MSSGGAELWSCREGAFREGLKHFGKAWARSLGDHSGLIDTWARMATTLIHCRMLVSDMHNLASKAQCLLGYDASRYAAMLADATALLSRLSELHLAWTAWLMRPVGGQVCRRPAAAHACHVPECSRNSPTRSRPCTSGAANRRRVPHRRLR